MRALPASLIAATLLVGGCGVQSSSLDPSSTVTISGKAVDAGGKPLANTRVVLVKELDIGEAAGGLFVTAVTLGLACIADHPPALCSQNAHMGRTDEAGAYSFSLKASETTGSFGVASTMEVVVGGSAGASLAEFTVQTTSLSLPDLRLWRPETTFGSDGRTTWSSLPASYGDRPAYTVEVYDATGNQWWVTPPLQSGGRVDPRILEDVNAAADIAARAHGTANGTTVDYTYTSAAAPFRGNAGAPPSRHAPCAPVVSNKTGAFDSSCAITSGTVGRHLPASFNGATMAVIDLGQERPMSLVVIKGCSPGCKVSVSNDLSSWTPAGTVSGPYASISFTESGRYVGVSGANVAGLRQISVW